MKKRIFRIGFILALVLAGSGFAQAQGLALPEMLSPSSVKPRLTPPVNVAMLFSLMTKKKPDFNTWAIHTQEWQEAVGAEKEMVRLRKAGELETAYTLLTLTEPLVVEMQVELSDYSPTTQGYIIKSFSPDLFVPVSYAGQNFALIPQGIMEYQWIGVPDIEAARKIEAYAAAHGRRLPMVFHLMPQSADGRAAISIEGVEYWMMGVSVREMALFALDGREKLWGTAQGMNSESAQKQKELLNLYQ